MRRSHADPEVESYLRKAERDLATAVRMSESGPEFADIICFHAEQYAEKALKGLMLALRQVPPRTQDLVVLLQAITKLDDGIGADFDREDGRELPQPFDHPCLALGEVPECGRVESAQERPADVPAESVIHPFLPFLDVFAARQSHGYLH